MTKFIKLTYSHNLQPFYVNIGHIESFRAHFDNEGQEDGSFIILASMRGDEPPIVVEENYQDIYQSLYFEEITNDDF